jgi:DhnA family fructose-bisphosphate aldolase class Ia
MDSKTYRLREFISPSDGHSLVVDTSSGLSRGALPGLEHFAEAVRPLLPLADGMVTSPGQAGKLDRRSRTDAALLVRADWTNALRGADFVLPAETISHIPLLSPEEGLNLGASALVVYFLLGYEEQIEAGCLKNTVQLALQGGQIGLPLIVDVQPSGPRVVLPSKAIELGVSYALEGGADGVAIPWPGPASLVNILTMMSGLAVWIKPTAIEVSGIELSEALSLGAAGLWLDERLFTLDEPAAALEGFRARVHAEKAGEEM